MLAGTFFDFVTSPPSMLCRERENGVDGVFG